MHVTFNITPVKKHSIVINLDLWMCMNHVALKSYSFLVVSLSIGFYLHCMNKTVYPGMHCQHILSCFFNMSCLVMDLPNVSVHHIDNT